MNSTVVPGLSSVTLKLSVVFFGFRLVPAFAGVTSAVKVDSGFLGDGATRQPRAKRTPTTAPMISLRKSGSPHR